MSWFKFTVAVFSIGCAILAHGQSVKPVKPVKPVKTDTLETPIKPDTLADLKAEYEHQSAVAAPYALLYQKAQGERVACYERMIADPLNTFCYAQDRELRVAVSVGQAPITKAMEAKDAYERELRKAERNKNSKP